MAGLIITIGLLLFSLASLIYSDKTPEEKAVAKKRYRKTALFANVVALVVVAFFAGKLSGNSISPPTKSALVYKFQTTLTDIEVSGKIIRSVPEVCNHTFDFNRMEIKYEGVNSDGEYVNVTFPIKDYYQEGLTTVIVVNKGWMKEIWFSVTGLNEADNIGYDLVDGKTRMACYGVTRIK
jgi:hypothetical protein